MFSHIPSTIKKSIADYLPANEILNAENTLKCSLDSELYLRLKAEIIDTISSTQNTEYCHIRINNDPDNVLSEVKSQAEYIADNLSAYLNYKNFTLKQLSTIHTELHKLFPNKHSMQLKISYGLHDRDNGFRFNLRKTAIELLKNNPTLAHFLLGLIKFSKIGFEEGYWKGPVILSSMIKQKKFEEAEVLIHYGAQTISLPKELQNQLDEYYQSKHESKEEINIILNK